MIRVVLSILTFAFTVPAHAETDIKEVITDSGLTAWLVEDHSIPFVALRLGFKGGASLEPADKRGATSLMMALLEEGTGALDARGFAREVEGLAARFSFDASDDAVSVSAQFLSENRQDALALLRGAVVEPSFPEDAIERVRAQVVSNIQSDEKDPNWIAGSAFDKAAFADHPYGSDSSGTVTTVAGLTRDDIVTAHQAALSLDRVYISAVGDITEAELASILDELLAGLPKSGAPLPEKADFLLDGGHTVVQYETPQSVVMFGHTGLQRDDPDFFAAFIANTIFGSGGFESRLMKEVREKRGLTYGVYSYLLPKDHAALVMGQVASGNDTVAEAVKVIGDEWRKLSEEGVTATELDEAKTYLTGEYPLRFDGNGTIANILVGMQMQDLPIDYAKTRNDKLNAVTLEEINRVIKRVYRPDDLHFVIVGQPEGF